MTQASLMLQPKNTTLEEEDDDYDKDEMEVLEGVKTPSGDSLPQPLALPSSPPRK